MPSLADIYEAYRSDAAFSQLRTEGIVLVPGEGSSRPNLLIVGEAPGASENTARRPFVGASGRVLRSLITHAAGLEESRYFITNTVKYRPPGNRTPDRVEIADSLPYLRQEYAALGSPPIVVAVGAVAKHALAPTLPGVLATAGKPFPMGKRGAAIWPMIHPAYALRNPQVRGTVEEHWEALGRFVREEFPIWPPR